MDGIGDIVRRAIEEDVGPGDITTRLTVDEQALASAEIVAKEDLIVSGLKAAREAFFLVDPETVFTPNFSDGGAVKRGEVVAAIRGRAASLLIGERVALNFMMRLSGVATLTRKFVEAAAGYPARIVDTRKTTPGLRLLEKEAVRHGGGHNHRYALYDGILIKDNHIAAVGGIGEAVRRVRAGAPHTMKIEIEVVDLAGLEEAIAAGADVVLLDNMTVDQMAEAVRAARGRVILEASGGVRLETVRAIAAAGVDIISAGALTHSAPSVDLSLRFV